MQVWANIGIVSATILTVATLCALFYRRVLRPLAMRARRVARRVDMIYDELIGDPAKGLPSIGNRVTRLEKAMDRLAPQWNVEPNRSTRRPR